LLSGLVRPMSVAASGVGAENTESVALAPEQQVVEGLVAQCPNGPLTVCVHPRRLRGDLEGFNALSFEDGVEGLGGICRHGRGSRSATTRGCAARKVIAAAEPALAENVILKGVNIPIRLLSWVFPVDGEVVGVAWCGTR